MEFDAKLKEDFPFLSAIFSDNSIKPNMGNEVSPKGACPTNGQLQGLHHLYQFGIEGSSSNPFFGTPNHSFDPFKPSSFGFFKDSNPYLPEPSSGGANTDEVSVSCMTIEYESLKKVDEKKKKRLEMRRASCVRKRSNVVVKGQWTFEEDRLLVRLVEEYGERRWSVVAKMMKGRVGKQCRERWHNHLRPNIKKTPWTEEEDKILIQAHTEIGNRWAEISKKLSGRSENTIKNHWNATKRRQQSKRKTKISDQKSLLLQEYIKNVLLSEANDDNNNNNSTTFSDSGAKLDDEMNNSDISQNSGIDKNEDFDHANMFFDCYNVGYVLDHDFDHGSSAAAVDFEMPFKMGYLMEGGDVKKEMDLLEMLALRKF